jgi:hypothetical protein
LEVDKVLAENEQLRAAIVQRTAELAVVNAVQQALAAEFDMQGIYDAVGDKVSEANQGEVRNGGPVRMALRVVAEISCAG